jgi:high-affinity iron transporter
VHAPRLHPPAALTQPRERTSENVAGRSGWVRFLAVGCCLCVLAVASAQRASATTAKATAARASGPTYVVPVVVGQLLLPIRTFRGDVEQHLTTLSGQLDALLAAEQAGDLAAAQADGLPAQLSWQEIGEDDKFYTAFGELGRKIDGMAAGLVGGIASPQFSGFHKIEYDLWMRRDPAAAATDTIQLQSLLARLSKVGLSRWLPGTARALSGWVLRCHEILEDADRDTLTGDDDYGSNTGVASITADVSATREMLTLLAPVINARAPDVVKAARRRLTLVVAAADSTIVDGHWVGVLQLPIRQRERLDGAIGSALETLAPISEIIRVAGGAT